jgi:hypothetical protein
MDHTRPEDCHIGFGLAGRCGGEEPGDFFGMSEIFGVQPEPTNDGPLLGCDWGCVKIVRLISERGRGRRQRRSAGLARPPWCSEGNPARNSLRSEAPAVRIRSAAARQAEPSGDRADVHDWYPRPSRRRGALLLDGVLPPSPHRHTIRDRFESHGTGTAASSETV